MKNEEIQTIYINMDDSGAIHNNDKCCIYGGIVFIGKNNRDDFMRKYIKILNRIKCKYCKSTKGKCIHKCPEIKDTNIYPNHMRWIFNLLKEEFCYATIINNERITDDIMKDKASRGRFRDYTQKRVIKRIIEKLIVLNKICPTKPVKLIIRIDQQETSTDTGRIFERDIYNELIDGTYNYNYNRIFKPILFSKLDIDLKYVLSHKHVCIQASDFIAGETRKIIINSNLEQIEKLQKLDYLDVKLFLP